MTRQVGADGVNRECHFSLMAQGLEEPFRSKAESQSGDKKVPLPPHCRPHVGLKLSPGAEK